MGGDFLARPFFHLFLSFHAYPVHLHDGLLLLFLVGLKICGLVDQMLLHDFPSNRWTNDLTNPLSSLFLCSSALRLRLSGVPFPSFRQSRTLSVFSTPFPALNLFPF